MNITRLVLDSYVGLEEAEEVAKELNLVFYEIIEAEDSERYEVIWNTKDGNTFLHYLEDDLTSVNYFIIEGERQEQYAEKIKQLVDVLDFEDIIEKLNEAEEEDAPSGLVYSIFLLATFSHEFQEDIFKYFLKYLFHEDSNVRYATILATGYVSWREFKEPLENVRDNDSELRVREFAEYMLEQHEKTGWQRYPDK